jgi:hypothetical protein
LKTKDIVSKIFKTLGLGVLCRFGRHKPGAGGFCLYLTSIIRRVSSGEVIGEPSEEAEKGDWQRWRRTRG